MSSEPSISIQPEPEPPPKQISPFKRALIVGGLVLVIGLFSSAVLPLLFPRADPQRLADLAADESIKIALWAFVLSWLWFAGKRVLALVGVGLLACAIVIGVWVLKGAADRAHTTFPIDAAADFELVEGDHGAVLLHRGLGIHIDAGSSNLETKVSQNQSEGAFVWSFQEEQTLAALTVAAFRQKISSEDGLTDFTAGFMRGWIRNANEAGLEVSVSREETRWDERACYSLVEGACGEGFFCIRVLPTDSDYPGYFAVVSAQSIAADQETASRLALSVSVDSKTPWSKPVRAE